MDPEVLNLLSSIKHFVLFRKPHSESNKSEPLSFPNELDMLQKNSDKLSVHLFVFCELVAENSIRIPLCKKFGCSLMTIS